MKKVFYLLVLPIAIGLFSSCDDDDNDGKQIINPTPTEQWGKTLRGDDQSLVDIRTFSPTIGNIPTLIKTIPISVFA